MFSSLFFIIIIRIYISIYVYIVCQYTLYVCVRCYFGCSGVVLFLTLTLIVPSVDDALSNSVVGMSARRSTVARTIERGSTPGSDSRASDDNRSYGRGGRVVGGRSVVGRRERRLKFQTDGVSLEAARGSDAL